VIDDFHLVKGKEIGALLNQIIKEELENLHIVVITRDNHKP
jgi:ATP/maltotriose-dependent transcriptional regulator MalT